jgi:hypothetical protein
MVISYHDVRELNDRYGYCSATSLFWQEKNQKKAEKGQVASLAVQRAAA